MNKRTRYERNKKDASSTFLFFLSIQTHNPSALPAGHKKISHNFHITNINKMGIVHSRIYKHHPNDQKTKGEKRDKKLRRTQSDNILKYKDLSVNNNPGIGGDARFPSLNGSSGATDGSIGSLQPKSIIGREFKAHGNPKYMLPGDDEELDRLLIQHYTVRYDHSLIHTFVAFTTFDCHLIYPL